MKLNDVRQKRRAFGVNLAAGLMLLLASIACNLSGGSTLPERGDQPAETVTVSASVPAPTETTEAAPTAETPTEPGMDAGKPAANTETVTTQNWEFSVVEVLRGDEALEKLEEASQFNGPPEEEAMEYVLVRVHVRNIGTGSEKANVDRTFFQSTGSANVIYKRPSIVDVKTPSPILQAELLPGEESEGWVTVLAAKDDSAPVLVVQPRVNGLLSAEEEWRYILLEP
jgi:hypothetical protein